MVANPPMTPKHFLKSASIGIAVALIVLVITGVESKDTPTKASFAERRTVKSPKAQCIVTAITELAEMGVPDSVLKAIAGHITQRMLEHYSHIRMNAKRQALDGLEAFRAEDVLRSLPHTGAEKVL